MKNSPRKDAFRFPLKWITDQRRHMKALFQTPSFFSQIKNFGLQAKFWKHSGSKKNLSGTVNKNRSSFNVDNASLHYLSAPPFSCHLLYSSNPLIEEIRFNFLNLPLSATLTGLFPNCRERNKQFRN